MDMSQKEPLYNSENVDKEGIRDVLDYALDKDGVLVHVDHPILEVIKENPELFPVNLDAAKRWIRLERELVKACCARLHENSADLTENPETTGEKEEKE
jgi:hypothetical protein